MITDFSLQYVCFPLTTKKSFCVGLSWLQDYCSKCEVKSHLNVGCEAEFHYLDLMDKYDTRAKFCVKSIASNYRKMYAD